MIDPPSLFFPAPTAKTRLVMSDRRRSAGAQAQKSQCERKCGHAFRVERLADRPNGQLLWLSNQASGILTRLRRCGLKFNVLFAPFEQIASGRALVSSEAAVYAFMPYLIGVGSNVRCKPTVRELAKRSSLPLVTKFP